MWALWRITITIMVAQPISTASVCVMGTIFIGPWSVVPYTQRYQQKGTFKLTDNVTVGSSERLQFYHNYTFVDLFATSIAKNGSCKKETGVGNLSKNLRGRPAVASAWTS